VRSAKFREFVLHEGVDSITGKKATLIIFLRGATKICLLTWFSSNLFFCNTNTPPRPWGVLSLSTCFLVLAELS